MSQTYPRFLLPAVGALCLACGDDGTANGQGTLSVVVSAEETITQGLPVGGDEGSEDYAVSFDKYLVAIGNVRVARSRGGREQALTRTFLVDMAQLPASGLTLAQLADVPAGTWDKVSFETPRANAESELSQGVLDADKDVMVAGGLTHWITGTVQRSTADGGPVRFDVRVSVPTLFSDCSFEGQAGVSVVENGQASATFTLHGDHMFFNAFPAAGEESVRRQAGWLLEADSDGDGLVTSDELAALDATDLFTQARGYSLAGAPFAIDSALDFVRAQLASQGHFRGEGECVWQVQP